MAEALELSASEAAAAVAETPGHPGAAPAIVRYAMAALVQIPELQSVALDLCRRFRLQCGRTNAEVAVAAGHHSAVDCMAPRVARVAAAAQPAAQPFEVALVEPPRLSPLQPPGALECLSIWPEPRAPAEIAF